MGLLDEDNYIPRYVPPKNRRFIRATVLSQESRDTELNNEGRTAVTEDFADSSFADRV